VWNYVALEAEVPKPGDFKATFVGETPIVINRGKDGALHAFVNRCAHRGALVCRELRGNRLSHLCIYHQWSYDLEGNLIGVPFRKGIDGNGGYAPDFDASQHSLHKLRIAAYHGLIFVSFAEEVEPLEDYIGPVMRPWLDRVFNRPVKVLGYARQWIGGNWKLYNENVRDPYHASLLHLFNATFRLARSSQIGGSLADDRGRHSLLHGYQREAEGETAAYTAEGIKTYQAKYALADPSLMETRQEYEIALTFSIHAIFPCLVVQQISNTLAARQIVPKGPDAFELIFTFFGYEDDDEEMRAMRIKQANLVGPAGFISLEDGHAIELVQQAIVRDREASSFIELGGRDIGSQAHLVTESSIRGFWQHYRELMGFN
jgi:phenylpropionate dioxygenase-like ring-hydroxylating dioxygenase large terminal subunit